MPDPARNLSSGSPSPILHDEKHLERRILSSSGMKLQYCNRHQIEILVDMESTGLEAEKKIL